MKQVIWTMYDKVGEVYSPISTGINVATVCRQLKQENAKVPEETLKDFVVVFLAEFNTENGLRKFRELNTEHNLADICKKNIDDQDIAIGE